MKYPPSTVVEGHLLADPAPLRITVLDGIRGLAALYVFLGHTYQQSPILITMPFLRWLGCGHYAVDVFIVLSGYSLMIAVARGDPSTRQEHFTRYMQRRARRILPAYYCAYLLALLSTGLAHLRRNFAVLPDTATAISTDNPFALDNIVAHLVLIHNLNFVWVRSVNGILWSVATEWQIYILFPLVLLPIWRRYGNLATICVMSTFGLLLAKLYPALAYTCPWYIGLFVVGMAASTLCFSPDPSYRTYKQLLSHKSIIIALIGIFLLIAIHYPIPPDLGSIRVPYSWAVDFLIAFMAAYMLLYLHTTNWEHNLLARYVFVPWLRNLGVFSYSLYLIHGPVLYKIDGILKMFQFTPLVLDLARFIVGVPSTIGIAYLFYWLVERRFLNKRQPKQPDKRLPLQPRHTA